MFSRLLFVFLSLFFSAPAIVQASLRVLSVDIASPLNGASVSGSITIAGTATDLGNGRVSISIDGGPFLLASGTTSWSFPWDSTSVPDGSHSITARAREFIGGPEAFDSVTITVSNVGGSTPSVAITSPASGHTFVDTFTVTGTSANATSVSLAVDGGAPLSVSGLAQWDHVFEPGSLSAGAHTLTATATNGSLQASDSITITIGAPPAGSQSFTYVSSVDGAAMTSKLWIPAGFDPQAGPRPLVVHLHGGGGTGNISTAMGAELDARGWIGIAPDGRLWGLANQGCTWQNSAAYVDSSDPDVGPGERDVLDAIDWAVATLPIDESRVYLTGFSMGGRGTYIIGLRNPDRFAAIAPMAPAIDMYEIFVRRPDPAACKEGMTGGQPGDSAQVDTMYTLTSGRFLIENAFNLPVFHAHGTLDAVALNIPGSAFQHGAHITTDNSFAGCHLPPSGLCFGHTPTLTELRAAHPEGYDWAFMFTPVDHTTDTRWLTGTPMVAGLSGTEDPFAPGTLLGIYDFFERRSLVHSPENVFFKTYTSEHRSAFWVELDSATPWLDTPAAVRARRDVTTNSIELALVRAASVALDLERAGVQLAPAAPLSLVLQPLIDAVLDPALAAPGESLTPSLVLRGDFADVRAVSVTRDGANLPASAVSWNSSAITLSALAPIAGATTIVVRTSVAYCEGAANSVGPGARISLTGSTSVAANDLVLGCTGLVPNSAGIFFHGATAVHTPFGDGFRCVAGAVKRLGPVTNADAAGTNSRALDLAPSSGSVLVAGSNWKFQHWYRDPAGPGGSGTNLSDALDVAFGP